MKEKREVRLRPSRYVPSSAPSHLQEAMSQGLISRTQARVVVPAKVSPNKQDLVQSYDQYVIVEGLTPEQFGLAAAALCDGDTKRAAKLFNVQYDIAVNRTTIRHRLVASAKKPQKALEKVAKGLIEANLAKDMKDALAKLQEMRGEPM